MDAPESGHVTGKAPSSTTRQPIAQEATARRRRSRTLAIYGGLLVAAVVAFTSHEWGATAHSWLAIAVIGVVTWHVLSQRRWITSAAHRRVAHPEPHLVVLNTALALDFVVVNLSGFPVWFWGVGGLLTQIHAVTAIAFLVLVPMHLVLNRHRLLRRLRARRRPASASAFAA